MIRLLSILAVAIICSTVQAAEPIIADDNSVIVSFTSWKGDAVDVEIFDDYGNVIYTETVTSLGTKKRYQLAQLPSGEYTIRTSNDLRVEEQVVTIDRGSVIAVGGVDVAYKPVITANAATVDVNYLTGDRNASISIADSNGATVYTSKFKGNSLNKRYDLSSLPAGDYTFKVSNGKTSTVTQVRR